MIKNKFIFTGLLSLSAIVCALRYETKPLAKDMFNISSFDSSDVQDWQTLRDALLRNIRQHQCAVIKNSFSKGQDILVSFCIAGLANLISVANLHQKNLMKLMKFLCQDI